MASILGAAYILAHAPGLVRYGSKPLRECRRPESGFGEQLEAGLRSFDDLVAYAPSQVFVGNLNPEKLWEHPAPWFRNPVGGADRVGPFGTIYAQQTLYPLLKAADQFKLVQLDADWLATVGSSRPAGSPEVAGVPLSAVEAAVGSGEAIPLFEGGRLVGSVRGDHPEDPSLAPEVMLENLAAKATGFLACRELERVSGLDPAGVEYLLSCSEDAVGDRYNRGGGNLAKAIAEMCGYTGATGSDVKAFCAGPVYALVHAAALVEAGVFSQVVVVGGGSLAKLGMKSEAHLKKGMPVLEDVLGGMAFLVGADDGSSPRLRLDAVGKYPVSAGNTPQAIMESLVVEPVRRAGLRLLDVDRFAGELHNPEVTVPAGSGDVPQKNYRLIAGLAALRGEIDRGQMDSFVRERGLPGFAPTQGHIPAGVPYLGHAMREMAAGRLRRAQIIAKGSLFLGRMTQLWDGLSVIIEKP